MYRKLAVALVLVFAGCFTVAGQNEDSAAPVKWERFRISSTKISVLFPKLPTWLHRTDACNQFTKNSYFAYAEGSAYELTVVEKAWTEIPKVCSARVPFGKTTLDERLGELRRDREKSVETSERRNGKRSYRFDVDGSTRWVIPDMEKDLWVELGVTRRPDARSEEERFVTSLDLDSEVGKHVGIGSARTLGDLDTGAPRETGSPTTAVTESVRFVINPRPSFSEEARKNNIQGSLRLKVTLLANGGIGDIVVVKSLPGLDEQAIAAAKKIVFLPQRVNGIPVTVTKTLEYGFSLY
jgi:TonB family protein